MKQLLVVMDVAVHPVIACVVLAVLHEGIKPIAFAVINGKTSISVHDNAMSRQTKLFAVHVNDVPLEDLLAVLVRQAGKLAHGFGDDFSMHTNTMHRFSHADVHLIVIDI